MSTELKQLSELLEELRQLLKQAVEREESCDDILVMARATVDLAKRIDRLVYQLAFIATSQGPLAELADKLLDAMVAKGLVSSGYVAKAMDDVRRWRERLAYKWF